MRKFALGGSAASGIATLVGREVGCEAFGESDKAASTDIHEISNWQDAHAWRDVAHLIEQKLEDKVIHPLRDTVMRYSGYSVYLGVRHSRSRRSPRNRSTRIADRGSPRLHLQLTRQI